MDYTGQIIDERYRIIRRLGEGGMGAVYLGKHLTIGRDVAVKFLRSEFQENEEILKRFFREAQAATAIRHQNIIDVLDMGVTQKGDPYLVMEYLEGESLSEMIRRIGPLDLGAACAVMEPVLNALAAAHAKGIVHRDLKPDNIFVAQNDDDTFQIKLIDFGISKIKSGDQYSKLTQAGTILGSPSYMCPEQVENPDEVDARADLFAIGIILYELLTGQRPFSGESYQRLLIALLTEEPRPPKETNPDFPDHVEPLLQKALRKDPEQRYQTADEMLSVLKQLGEFEERNQRLSQYTIGAGRKSIAGGDLGHITDASEIGQTAGQMLSQIVDEATPSAWAKITRSARRQRNLTTGLVLLIGLLVGVAATIWALKGGEPSVSRPTTPPSTAVGAKQQQTGRAVATSADKKNIQPTAVKIKIEGVPAGASIFYAGTPVHLNPFPVDYQNTIKEIRVEKQGFEPFVTSLVPSADQVIKVALVPIRLDAGLPPPPKSNKASKKKRRPKKSDQSFIDDF